MKKKGRPGRSVKGSSGLRSRAARAVMVLLAVLLVGTVGFMAIEGWTFWRSLFFTLITVTTVGYGAEGLTVAGERFTTILLIGGISTAAYALGVLVEVAVSYRLDWRRRMQQQINRLRNHYIVCGFGRIGRSTCEHLLEASFPFVVIEADAEMFEQARSLDYLAMQANATEDDALAQAGIERARGIVCAVDSDSENIVITLSARELRPDLLIIARADEEGATRKLLRAGATQVVSPFLTGAGDIANAIIRPHLTELLDGSRKGEGGFELGEIVVEKNSSLAGQAIRDLGNDDADAEVVFVAIKRPDGTSRVRPGGEFVFQAGDVVIIASGPAGISRMSARAMGRRSKAA